MTNVWPLQKNCDAFYGNPYDAGFAKKFITQIATPWHCFYGSLIVSHISVHKKCADAFEEWFEKVWENAGKSQTTVNSWGMSQFAGSFVVRVKRGGSTPSMHAYGCAMDFDAARNSFKDHTPNFKNDKAAYAGVVVPFKALSGTWGGDWPNSTDGMHFQFATVS